MPGTRTAPDVNSDITSMKWNFRLVDERGSERTIGLVIIGGTLASLVTIQPLIEGLGDALQAATNSSLWAIQLVGGWVGVKSAANAVDAVFTSVDDNIVINLKDTVNERQQSVYIPAPLAQLVENGEVVDTTDPLYTAVRDAYQTAANSGTPAQQFVAITTRFTERRDKNDSTPA